MKDKHVERGSRFRHNLDRFIGCSLIGILSLLRKRRTLPADVSTIGVVMFGAIGDTLLAASIVQDLKVTHPFARIVAFVSNSNKATLELLDGFDQVVVVPIMRPHAAVAAMRGHPVDLLIDTSQWARIGALLSRLARARFTVGFRTTRQYRHFAFDAAVPHRADQHEIDNFHRLLDGVGIRGRGLPRFKPALLAEMAGATPKHPYLIFHPWASGYRSEMREWATRNWVALGKLVRGWGFELVITGGPEDVARATALADEFGPDRGVSILAGRASLRETTIKVGRATAVVSVNTGIMHLAALLDVPMIALHGPTNPKRWGPVSEAAVVVGPGPECGCGYLNLGFEYPASPPACMERIDVAEVARLLRPMLAKPVPVAL